MPRLAAWSLDRPHGEDASQPQPKRVESSHIGLEKHFEDWIANDVTLIAGDLTLVGRQITIDDGRLDLLAIDSQERWVVIEIKPEMLYSNALHQALSYASSIARLSAEDLYEKLEPGFCKLGDAEHLSRRVKQLLEVEQEKREIAVLLVGAGIHAGLERMNGFLGRFGIPTGVVSFQVFELEGGPKLLVREVIDEPPEPPPAPRRKLFVETIRDWAVEAGVGGQFDRLLKMSEAAGLPVQPQRASVRVAPPADKRLCLLYAQPQSGDHGGALYLEADVDTFVRFFPHISKAEAEEALRGVGGAYVGGAELDKQLDRVERFLTDKLPEPETGGG